MSRSRPEANEPKGRRRYIEPIRVISRCPRNPFRNRQQICCSSSEQSSGFSGSEERTARFTIWYINPSDVRHPNNRPFFGTCRTPVLRHTSLRKWAEEKGVRYARLISGQVSHDIFGDIRNLRSRRSGTLPRIFGTSLSCLSLTFTLFAYICVSFIQSTPSFPRLINSFWLQLSCIQVAGGI